MKKLVFNFALVITGLLLGLVIFSFKSSPVSSAPLPYTGICDVPPHCVSPFKKGMDFLTLETAIKWVSIYDKNQAVGIDAAVARKILGKQLAGDFSDSRFITFPSGLLKNYLFNIESQLDKFKPLNSSGAEIKSCDLGIRFYYATYPRLFQKDANGNEVVNVNNKYGKHTLLMIPTYFDEALNRYVEFFPGLYDSDKKVRSLNALNDPAVRSQYETEMRGYFVYPIVSVDPAKNQGTLCPPPGCDETLSNMAKQSPIDN